MKVLLTAVGRRDPFAPKGNGSVEPDPNNPGPVLLGIARVTPDVVYLLPTSGGDESTLGNGERTAEEITRRSRGAATVRVLPLALPDPTDYVKVVEEFLRASRLASAEHGKNVEWHVLLSPGAPQFRLAWTLLVLNGALPATCWEVRDPKYEGERVWEANIRFLQAPGIRDRFKAAWESCDFLGAQHVARDWSMVAPSPEQQRRAAWVAELMTAYRSWDAVRWRAALEELRKRRREAAKLQLPDVLSKHLDPQEQALSQIDAVGDEEGFWNLADLYHNARRRIRADQHTDALARFRRIAEGVAYRALRDRGCTLEREWMTLTPAIEALLPSAIRQHVTIRRDELGRVDANLPTALFFLCGLTAFSRTAGDQILSYTDQRNRTIAAHGMQPVDKRLAERALDRLKDLLVTVLPGPIPLDEYPFSVAAIQQMTPVLLSLMEHPA
jgi:hypothetical protein